MTNPATIAVIGAGPAGLMAAEVLSAAGAAVTVYDRMPSVGRKLLMAGRGGLNLTHSEPLDRFVARYAAAAATLRPILEAFPPQALVAWANGLGAETFVGSSGRVFPKAMKASPLLRAWLARLDRQGVQFRLRRRWLGWRGDALLFDTAGEHETSTPDATLLALGGASWPRLGAKGDWATLLGDKGVTIAPFQSANCGFTIAWSANFRERFAGQPIKNARFAHGDIAVRGEAVVTAYGIEGGAIYALSALLRAAVVERGLAALDIDLRPDLSAEDLARRLSKPRGKDSQTNHLRKALHLAPVEINLLREPGPLPSDAAALAHRVKNIRLDLTGMQGLERAISTAGGVSFDAVDQTLMLKALPRVYVAGEMLDWEAPTGGYLLQACFATGAFAARAILARIGA